MKICVFGAGAIGGFMAAHLGRAPEVEVSVVARGAHLEAIRRDGLKIVLPKETFTTRVRATDDALELGRQDVVIVALKQHQVSPALEAIMPLIGDATTVVPPTTGIPYWYFYGLPGPNRDRQIDALDPGGAQWRMLGPERAVGCVYWIACEVTAPGTVTHDGAFANFPIGEPDGSTSPRIAALGAAMEAGGLKAPIVDDIRAWLWMKMISSLAWNPVAVLTGATNGEIAKHPEVVAIVRRMMEEAGRLAARFGVVDMPMSIDERLGLGLSIVNHKMSMLQDLERGRPPEAAVLLDSLAAMRALADVRTPTIDAVTALLALRVELLHAAPPAR